MEITFIQTDSGFPKGFQHPEIEDGPDGFCTTSAPRNFETKLLK
jgi:hypothetical protein